jgi:hypothetical protein
MKRLSRILVVVVLVAIVAATLASLALGAGAKPSVSLRAKPATVAVGRWVTFSGMVRHAVSGDRTVKLWLLTGTTATLKKTGAISSTGAYRFAAKAVKAGTCTFRVTYTADGTTYRSNKAHVTITQ